MTKVSRFISQDHCAFYPRTNKTPAVTFAFAITMNKKSQSALSHTLICRPIRICGLLVKGLGFADGSTVAIYGITD